MPRLRLTMKNLCSETLQ